MANLNRGEVSFEGKDGKRYTLSFSINVMCELDDALKVEDAVRVVMSSGKATTKQYRTMFFLALNHHHPEIKDEKEAAKLLIYGEMLKVLGEAIVAANPQEDTKAPTSPPQGGGPQSPTGPAS